MTGSYTIDMKEFVKNKFIELNEQEDFANKLGIKHNDPKTKKVVKMLLSTIENKRAALREMMFMMYQCATKSYPDIEIKDNYDMFENFEFKLDISKLDIPKVKYP